MMENERVAEPSLMDAMIAASPSLSSYSSSDLDTESTGSFFYDKSITLGSLMGLKSDVGLSTRVIVHGQEHPSEEPELPRRGGQNTRSKKSRSWWRLCRSRDDYDCHRNSNPSLGQFLEVERRTSVSDNRGERMYIDVMYDEFAGGQAFSDRNLLFSEGRILPPQSAQSRDQSNIHTGRSDSMLSCIPTECCFTDCVSRRSSVGAS
ncbi:hypothetical protein SUGI_0806330 [Cryptomeria japonica]|uniref:uncharacterized protein At3g17950 n=1 Tax=Cryptomeria japonica TaxID=3369 RepID=UPI002414C9E8|nr:uncharacterized protein At3g17950 [Cryptomeria japonica]GLJ39468.1 hypothetical protein SUGI_0806330 [Cryptomeria japonica]